MSTSANASTNLNLNTPLPAEKEQTKSMLTRQLTSNFDDFKTFMEDEDNELKRGESAFLQDAISKLASESHAYSPMETSASHNVEMRLLVGVATDIGGGNENQDKAMVYWAGEGERHLIMGVFDGHGRELGELAAIVSRDYVKSHLSTPEQIDALAANPQAEFERIFAGAHEQIKKEFKSKYDENDWEIIETEEGYLTRRNRRAKAAATNINGGTTATVVVILDGWRVLVANVGDSTALFGGINSSGKPEYVELSAEHSPEAPSEFIRVRNALPSKTDSRQPDLKFVYDVFERYPNGAIPKHQCPPIFTVDPKDPNNVRCNGVGYYYKNVRNEWATLVTTPPSARFQDALAFTRSLGDLHLHVYGVTHVPEVREFNLNELHEPYNDYAKCSVIFVCTDGVWDNWKYGDLIARTLKDKFVTPALLSSDAQGLTEEIMAENIRIAQQNFGSQADNMTGIVCLVQSPTQAASMSK